MKQQPLLLVAFLVAATFAASSTQADDPGLRARLDDKNGTGTDLWIYNDINKAIAKAKAENKPLFVTFRCVPCHSCQAFDAEVANGSDQVDKLARQKFIAVRQVEMKGVDLSQFQFDHDLNWAAVFINADGTVYARYGTQSAEGPDAYNSIEGLLATMNRVLELHAEYPRNKADLAGKHPPKNRIKSALKMPGIQNPDKLAQQTSRRNCIHCHNIHDAENELAQRDGSFSHDLLWRYPLPDNVGLKIDRVDGVTVKQIVEGSPADKAGLQQGEQILRVNGQRVVSIADMQWALNPIENKATTVTVEGSKSGQRTIKLSKGWKEYDISWRGSIWSLSPRLRVWTPALSQDKIESLGLDEDRSAFLVKWINRGSKGGRSAFDSGLRQGDVIVAINGKPIRNMDPAQFNVYIKLNYKVGQSLPVTVRRGKRDVDLKLKLVE